MPRKLSFITMGTPQLDHRGAIALALRCGFGGIDIRYAEHLGEVKPGASPEQLAEVVRDFSAAGLRIPSLLCYDSVRLHDPLWWHQWREQVLHFLEVGQALGAEFIRVFGPRSDDAAALSAARPKIAEILRQLLDQPQFTVGIIMQNHKGMLLARDIIALSEAVGSPRFGLAFAPDHVLLCREADVAAILPQAFAHTRQVYLADLCYEADKHRAILPGKGQVPLKETVQFFERRGFAGFYAFKWEKIWQAHLEEPEVAMPHFMDFMRSFSGL